MSKKFVSIIGIIVGLAIVIIGFSLQDTRNYTIGKSLEFGADFYTEIYDVTQDVGRAINNAINDLICAVSWLIISLGAIDICYFSYKLVKSSEFAPSTCNGSKNSTQPNMKSNINQLKEPIENNYDFDDEIEYDSKELKKTVEISPVSGQGVCDFCLSRNKNIKTYKITINESESMEFNLCEKCAKDNNYI